MSENKQNYGLRVRSNCSDELHLLLVTVIAAMAFLPFVISGAFLCVVFFALLLIKRTRRAVLAQKEICVLACGITAWSLLGSVISGNVIGMLISLGVLMILTVGAYLLTVMDKELFKRATLVVAIGSTVTAAVALVQRLLGQERPVAGAFNANYLGAIAALSALFALVRFFEKTDEQTKPKAAERALYATSFFANCLTVLITESRSALMALMVCVIVFTFLKKWYVLCVTGAIVGAVAVVLAISYGHLFWWNSLFGSFSQRISIWKDAFKSFAQNAYTMLIGRGPMSYYHVWEAEGLGQHNHAHSILFDTLINVGVIGTAMYALLIFVLARGMLKKLKNGDRAAFIAVALMIVEVIVQGIPDVTIMWHQTAPLFLLGCAAVCAPNSETSLNN